MHVSAVMSDATPVDSLLRPWPERIAAMLNI
jgi:hypothetical protein